MKLAARTLERGPVRLEPFEERHRDGLAAAAHADPELFRYIPFPVATQGYDAWFDWLRAEQDAGRAIPHAVLSDGHIYGQTCYLNVRPRDAGVEIGSTWYTRPAQRSIVNPSCKLLLLGNAFEQGAERVELKTDALNERSRGAMLKMGATFEGIHRKHMRRADGTLRDTAWFSVIRDDWPAVRAGLEARLAAFNTIDDPRFPPNEPTPDEMSADVDLYERARARLETRLKHLADYTKMPFEITDLRVSSSPAYPMIVRARVNWTHDTHVMKSLEMFWTWADGTEGGSGQVLG